jgi:hypothetical protein
MITTFRRQVGLERLNIVTSSTFPAKSYLNVCFAVRAWLQAPLERVSNGFPVVAMYW